MTIFVFCGPTLSFRDVVDLIPEATPLGPAACGDVYRSTQCQPAAIVLIDGYFEHRLAVWHKELLCALAQGVRVYGAASMGALRAVELARYGMIGVGRVFEQFLSGQLEDDDEVAVVHESAERGYAARSTALVNLRATLLEAELAEVLSTDERNQLISDLKRLYYPGRDSVALSRIARSRLTSDRLPRFERWLEEHGIRDQKHFDAVELLHRVRAEMQTSVALKHEGNAFLQVEPTDAWETLKSKVSAAAIARPVLSQTTGIRKFAQAIEENQRVLVDPLSEGEIRTRSRSGLERLEQREPELVANVLRRATERVLAVRLAQSEGVAIAAAEVQEASERFRRERGLLTPEHTSRWMTDNKLDVLTFSALIHDTVLTMQFEHTIVEAVGRELPNTLRVMGLLERVVRSGASDDTT